MKSIRYKKRKLRQSNCVHNILAYYYEASPDEIKEGQKWYENAHNFADELARRFHLTAQQTAGIIAAFSPQTDWTTNKKHTLNFLLNPKAMVAQKLRWLKSKSILKTTNEREIYDLLSVSDKALKTKSFYLNILHPDINTGVTIDRHAIAICLQATDKTHALSDGYAKITNTQYLWFEECYTKAAQKLTQNSGIEVAPHVLQAIVWGVYRRLRQLKQHGEIIYPF